MLFERGIPQTAEDGCFDSYLRFIWYESVVNGEYLLKPLPVRVKPHIFIVQHKAVLGYGLTL